MGYTKDDIIEYVQEDDVKFIRLAFCDPYGHQKNISVMPNALKKAFDEGIEIDGKNIFGTKEKLLLLPDPNTISVLPWRPTQGRVVRMFCDIKTKNNEYFDADTRKLLIDACDLFKKKRLNIHFQIKYDFYLFKLDEEGNKTKIPYDYASYLDIAPEDRGENVRREICLSLTEMDINPVGSHHEIGPGQNRIYFEPSKPLKAADDAITFTSVVKTISARNGLFADFSARPLEGYEPNKCLIEIESSNNDIEELFINLKSNFKAMEVFLNPSSDSNDLIVLDDNIIRIEASSSMNPYLGYALIMFGMLEKNNDSYEKLDVKDRANKSEFINKYVSERLKNYYLK